MAKGKGRATVRIDFSISATDEASWNPDSKPASAFEISRIGLNQLNQGFQDGLEPVANPEANLDVESFGPVEAVSKGSMHTLW